MTPYQPDRSLPAKIARRMTRWSVARPLEATPERAQICFTSAFRDMWITGRTVMAKAIIFGMAASAIGIFSYVQLGMAPKIMWAGPNAAIGGLLFGFGIVLDAAQAFLAIADDLIVI